MKSLLFLAAVLALATARPEQYKETEDFNYERSSTDEGYKAGFYGAQRGNMGGNYEHAHNMDGLAQHQMGTAVKQVEGELAEASKMNSGQVYTSTNSKGMFGSGHYDTSNLHGRNFQESGGISASDSHSHSALSSHQYGHQDQLASSMHNSGFGSNSHTFGHNRLTPQTGNLQAAESIHDGGYNFGSHAAGSSHSTGYSSQSGYQSHSTYGSSDANQHSTHSAYETNPQQHLTYTVPVRVYVRPGGRVAVPVGVQTYDATHSAGQNAYATHSASTHGQNAYATHSASTQGQNSLSSEAELLSRPDQPHISNGPTGKNYESQYSYRKQWERRDEQPGAITLSVPTENPLPANSELNEDASHSQYHASGHQAQSGYSSRTHNAYDTKSSSQSHQSAASQQAGSNFNSHGAYTGGSADSASVLDGIDTQPKSYQSSFSYHKSWERKGDPYEIKPAGAAYSGEDLQRLTSGSHKSSYQSEDQAHQDYSQGSSGLRECCVPTYRRVARAIRRQDERELGQQTQQVQQGQWENLEDLTQQSQTSWNRPANYRPAYSQSQLQQNQRENLEDLTQHSQTSWDRPSHTQQQVRRENLEDLTQQSQSGWSQVPQESQDLTQQVRQPKWGKLEDQGQVQQNTWQNMDQLQQRHSDQDVLNAWPEQISGPQAFEGQEQQSQNVETAWKQDSSEKFENQEQQSQQFESKWKRDSSEKFEDQEQQSQHFESKWKQDSSHTFENHDQQSQHFESKWKRDSSEKFEDQEQQSQHFESKWKQDSSHKFENQEQQSQHFESNWKRDSPETFEGQEQQSNNFDAGWKPGSSGVRQQNLADQQETKEFGITDFNQEQQGTPNIWSDQSQQESQTNMFESQSNHKFNKHSGFESFDQTYLQSQGHDDSDTDQQANKPWGSYGYLDQQQEVQKTSFWPSTSKPEYPINVSPSDSYNKQQVHPDKPLSFGMYDWSHASDQSSTINKQISSIWDKISQLDGMSLGNDYQERRQEQEIETQHSTSSAKTNEKQDTTTKSTDMFQPDPDNLQTTKKPRKPDELPHEDVGRGDIGPEKSRNHVESTQDVGRGDIGPEADFDDEPHINANTPQKNSSTTEKSINSTHINPFYVSNTTYRNTEHNNSWGQDARNSFENKTNSQQGHHHHDEFTSVEGKTQSEGRVINQNVRSQVKTTTERSKVESQDSIPLNHFETKLEQPYHVQSNVSEFGSVDTDIGKEGQLQQSNQNIFQNWEQSESGLGQQLENSWGQQSESSLGKQSESGLVQQSQSGWGQHSESGLEQQSESGWVQQSQSGLEQQSERGLGQQSESGLVQQSQSGWGQHSESGLEQQSENGWVQQSQSGLEQQSERGLGHLSESGWEQESGLEQQSESGWSQQSQSGWGQESGLEQQSQSGWGQQLESSFAQVSQQHEKEVFGGRTSDEQQSEGQFSVEHFNKKSTELDDVYTSNHNLPHYYKTQKPEKLQMPETKDGIPEKQTALKNTVTEVPVEPTTSKPGFWTSAKNKITSWFKSS